MKKLIITVLLFVSYSILHSQKLSDKAEITLSKPYEVVDGLKFYFSHEDMALSFKFTKNEMIIQTFDAKTGNEKSRKEYEKLPKSAVVEQFVQLKDKLYFFYSLWDRKNKTEQLFCRQIDFDKGTFLNSAKRILAVRKKLTGIRAGGMQFGFGISFGGAVVEKFDFKESFDEKTLLIKYRLNPKVKSDAKNKDIIGFNVFDEEMNMLWKKEVKMPYTEKKMDNVDYGVDSEGNAYMATFVYLDNSARKSKKGKPNYKVELFKIGREDQKLAKIPVKLDSKFISDITFFEAGDGNMICAGFYSKEKKAVNADGIFTFNLNNDFEVQNQSYYEIPLEIINQYVSKGKSSKNKKKDKKGKAEFEDLELNKLILSEDGSSTLVGQQQYVIVSTTHYNNRIRQSYQYYYNDLLVTKIDANGKLLWMKKLPKSLTSSSAVGLSYEYLFYNNKHHFIFLDNAKNIDLPTDKPPYKHVLGLGGFATVYRVDADNGDVEKLTLFDVRNVKGMKLAQAKSSRIMVLENSGGFLLEGYKKKKEDIIVRAIFTD